MANKTILIILIIGFIISLYGGYCQASRAYMLAKAYQLHGQSYVSDEIYYVDTARRYLQNIFKINLNYYKMSGSTNPDYYNLEHPPLGKYIIAAAMILCGDKPLCWRLPGVIESFLIPPLVFLAVSRILSKREPLSTTRIIAATIASLAAASDKIIFMDASVAMLDIHLAFFTTLALLFISYRRFTLASAAAALAFMTKMTGLSVIFMLFIIIILNYKNNIKKSIYYIFKSILIIFIISIIIYIPLIYYFGLKEIITATLDALKWHTTSRPPGPPVSGPTGWLINANPFYFTYNMMIAGGITTPLTEIAGFASATLLTAVALSSLLRKERALASVPGSIHVISVLALFALIYAMGNHTFYSFYAVVWAPGIAMSLGELIIFAEQALGSSKIFLEDSA